MATLTLQDLDDALKLKLRVRAASQNRSMEEEARQILRTALMGPEHPRESFVTRVKSRFDGLGDVQLPIDPRESVREPLAIHAPRRPMRICRQRPLQSRGADQQAGRRADEPPARYQRTVGDPALGAGAVGARLVFRAA